MSHRYSSATRTSFYRSEPRPRQPAGGRTDWTRLKTLTGLELSNNTLYPLIGRFDGAPGADPLVIDGTRFGLFYSKATGLWRSAYPY